MRAEKAIADAPDRFEGIGVPTSTDVLSNLGAYITNAMEKDEGRKIQANNKKWRLCLGESCADLLEYLGFTTEVSLIYLNKDFQMLSICIGRRLEASTA